MIFNIGNTLLSRYTLVSLLLDKPGLTAWHAHDRVLAQDCQLFITNQISTSDQVQNLASWLGASRNRHFTKVQHLHAEDDVCVVVTDIDDGVSLSDYLATDAPVSVDAMRTVIGETATAAVELQNAGFQHRRLLAEFVRVGRNAITLADLPVSPLFSHPYLGLSAHDIMLSSQATVLRQLGMLLYQMITRMPYIPGQTTSTSTLDAARIAIPDEFRILCMRTLGLQDDSDPTPNVPVVTTDEFLALLGPWKPASALTSKDLLLPESGVSESIQDAMIATIARSDLAPVPKSLLTFDATKHPNPNRKSGWNGNNLFQPDQVENLPASDTAMYDAFSIGSDTMSDSSIGMSRNPAADILNASGLEPIPFPTGEFATSDDSPALNNNAIPSVGAQNADAAHQLGTARNTAQGVPAADAATQVLGSGSSDSGFADSDKPTLALDRASLRNATTIVAPSLVSGDQNPLRDANANTMAIPGNGIMASQPDPTSFSKHQPAHASAAHQQEQAANGSASAASSLAAAVDAARAHANASADASNASGSTPTVPSQVNEMPTVAIPGRQAQQSLQAQAASAGSQGGSRTGSNANSQAGGDVRPSVIPTTQPMAVMPTVPNRSLANLERNTAEYKEQHYHRRHTATPPSFKPAEPAYAAKSDDYGNTDTYTSVAAKKEHKGGRRFAIISLIVVLVLVVALTVSAISGAFQNILLNKNDHSTWPSDLAAATSSTATESESSSSSSASSSSATPSPTNTTAYTVTSINFVSNPNGLEGYAFPVTLSQEEPVSRIVISSPSSGGTLSIYANSDASNPQNGAAVGSASFDSSGTTTVTLTKTTNMSKFVIWVGSSDMPTNGTLRINNVTAY